MGENGKISETKVKQKASSIQQHKCTGAATAR
jgi:hypothetical protein